MSSVEELELSIKQYEAQLAQVDEAIKNCTNNTERSSMENLKCDLNELLELTRETLKEQTGQPAKNNEDEAIDDDGDAISHDPFVKEMELFMSEIKNCESKDSAIDEHMSSGQTSEDVSMDLLNKFKEELKNAIGQKCSAPYTFAWGAKEYHNAIICSLVTDLDKVGSLDDIKVTVLYTNPVHRNMVPCPFYLEGECRFDNDKCRFSHGECARYVDLREYKKPIFSLLEQIKYPVLAKQSDSIWYKGVVISSDFENKTCQIKLEANRNEVKCDFHDILPIEDDKQPFIPSSDSESENEDEIELIRQANLIQKSLLTPATDQALGEWEKHTRGIGSRIMQKFGYIVGTGLGHNGEGIVVPISAQILPPGRSLDHCMELREAANGDKDLFSVEKMLKRMKEKQERVSAKTYEREKQKTDVFSFINDNVLMNMPTTSSQIIENQQRSKFDLKTHTNKSLNVESFKIGEEIRRIEKKILNLENGLKRHKQGTPMSQQLNKQLNECAQELTHLRKSEINLKKEQVFRKDKTKLTIF